MLFCSKHKLQIFDSLDQWDEQFMKYSHQSFCANISEPNTQKTQRSTDGDGWSTRTWWRSAASIFFYINLTFQWKSGQLDTSETQWCFSLSTWDLMHMLFQEAVIMDVLLVNKHWPYSTVLKGFGRRWYFYMRTVCKVQLYSKCLERMCHKNSRSHEDGAKPRQLQLHNKPFSNFNMWYPHTRINYHSSNTRPVLQHAVLR